MKKNYKASTHHSLLKTDVPECSRRDDVKWTSSNQPANSVINSSGAQIHAQPITVPHFTILRDPYKPLSSHSTSIISYSAYTVLRTLFPDTIYSWSESPTTTLMLTPVFWDMTPCTLVHRLPKGIPEDQLPVSIFSVVSRTTWKSKPRSTPKRSYLCITSTILLKEVTSSFEKLAAIQI